MVVQEGWSLFVREVPLYLAAPLGAEAEMLTACKPLSSELGTSKTVKARSRR